MKSAPVASLRAQVGSLASRMLPNLDERAWRRTRRAQVKQLRAEGAGLDLSSSAFQLIEQAVSLILMRLM